jgi:hypothetical protein
MKVFRGMLYSFVVIVLFGGCNSKPSKELSRSQAKSAIEASSEFKDDGKLTLEKADVENGIKAGYWVQKDSMFGPLLELTPLGHKYFASFEPQIAGRIVNCVKPPKLYVVEVTGITDAPSSVDGNLKVVEVLVGAKFEGEMADITKVLSITPTKGEIVLRRYDDGWRIQKE